MSGHIDIKKIIYFDNAATTKPSYLFCTLLNELNKKYGFFNTNTDSPASNIIKLLQEHTFSELLSNIGLNDKLYSIAMTAGATEANKLVINHYAKKGKVIISDYEHKSIYEMKNDNSNILTVPIDTKTYQIDINVLETLLHKNKDVKLVSIMLANNEIPVINDIESIYKICKKYKVLFHTDAVQIFGKYKDIKYNADFITFSLHKLNGYKCFGGLIYLNSEQNVCKNLIKKTPDPLVYITFFQILKTDTYNKLKSHCISLRNHLKKQLEREVINHKFIEPPNKFLNPSICFISFTDMCSIKLKKALSDLNVYVSIGSACNTSDSNQSHVVSNSGLGKYKGLLRISFSIDSNINEIDEFIIILKTALKKSLYNNNNE